MNDTQQPLWSRRDFGKAAAAASFAVLSARAGKAQTNEDTIRVGLIGCGGRGTGAVRNCLEGNDNVKLVAMADLFPDHLESKRRELEGNTDERIGPKVDVTDETCFAGWDAYQRLLATDVDLIIHGTPPYCRPEQIYAAVEAGKHIFTEKPAAVDAPGIRRFMEAARLAEEKGLTLVAGTQRRHQKSYIETIKQIQDGAIGDIISGRAYWYGTTPWVREREEGWDDVAWQIRNWVNLAWCSGDNIVEQHVHNIDVINWVMGTHPREAIGSGGRAWKPSDPKYGDMFDHFAVDYEYNRDQRMVSMCRHWYESYNFVSEEVFGTKGSSRCRDMARDDADPYVQEHINCIRSIRNEGPYYNEGIQVAESTLTAIMGRMAAYRGERVRWNDALEDDERLVPEVLAFGNMPVPPVPRPGAPA